MADALTGRRVAILAADGVERVELERPREAVQNEGAQTEVLSITEGEIQARDHDLYEAGTVSVDRLVGDASVDDYDALLLPGGTVNPDKLRMDEDAVGFVRDFVGTGKLVGVICHGPWTLVEAGVAKGRTLTSFWSLRTDLRNAGANVVDQEVVTDHGLVSSRSPDDLPAFCAKVVEEFAEGRHPVHDAGATAGG
jgi:protease I